MPVGLAAFIASWRLVPERRRAAEAKVDFGGIALSALALFSLTLALIQGNGWGWSSARVIALFVVASVGVVVFVVWEIRAESPMLDLRLFRIRSFAASNAAFLLIGVAMMGSVFLLVIFMVNVMGYSELRAGIAITPMPLTGLILAPIVGRVTDRIGPRLPAALGAAGFGVGLLMLARLDASAGLGDIAWRVVILGVGMGFSMPSFMAAGMGSLPDEHAGVGSGAINTARQLGFVLGVAVLVAVFSHTMTTALTDANAQAKLIVAGEASLAAPMKSRIIQGLDQATAAAARGGPTSGGGMMEPLSDLPQPTPGTPQASRLRALKTTIGGIYRGKIGGAFALPFYVASVTAFLMLIPATMTGRRLGAHQGAHEGRRATSFIA